jgi:hypothetical protein
LSVLVIGIPDRSENAFFVRTRSTMEISKGFLGAKLRSGDGQAYIFLIGGFAFASPNCADLIGFVGMQKSSWLSAEFRISDRVSLSALTLITRS